jgi:hypothetical protein
VLPLFWLSRAAARHPHKLADPKVRRDQSTHALCISDKPPSPAVLCRPCRRRARCATWASARRHPMTYARPTR